MTREKVARMYVGWGGRLGCKGGGFCALKRVCSLLGSQMRGAGRGVRDVFRHGVGVGGSCQELQAWRSWLG